MSVLDKLKALDEERAKLLDDAKKEALEAAHKAIADLNALGFDFRLVEGPSTSTARRPPRERSEGEAPKRQARDLSLVQSASLRPSLTTTAGHIARRNLRGHSPTRNLRKGVWPRLPDFLLGR